MCHGPFSLVANAANVTGRGDECCNCISPDGHSADHGVVWPWLVNDTVPVTPLCEQICHEPCKLQCPCGDPDDLFYDVFYGDEGAGHFVYTLVCVVTLLLLIQLRCWTLAQYSGVLYQTCSSTAYDVLDGRDSKRGDHARVLRCTAGNQ